MYRPHEPTECSTGLGYGLTCKYQTSLKRSRDKRSSLLCPIVSDEEKSLKTYPKQADYNPSEETPDVSDFLIRLASVA